MISYKPLFELLKARNISQYKLIEFEGISSATVYRLRHDMSVTTKTIETLCCILDCEQTDIMIISPPYDLASLKNNTEDNVTEKDA